MKKEDEAKQYLYRVHIRDGSILSIRAETPHKAVLNIKLMNSRIQIKSVSIPNICKIDLIGFCRLCANAVLEYDLYDRGPTCRCCKRKEGQEEITFIKGKDTLIPGTDILIWKVILAQWKGKHGLDLFLRFPGLTPDKLVLVNRFYNNNRSFFYKKISEARRDE